uniref:Endoglucanase n=1 Tax=Radopholus similis TaxID=46012 RepID=B2XBK6_RADSI|nr:GHF5 endo-1,4-beta-glucanase precursor [Radopholus similis]
MNCLFLLPLFFALAGAADPPYGALSVSGTNLKGSGGQNVALHGMSLFWSQWESEFYNEETVRALKCQWNSNVVRAAMAVEEGGYLSNPSAEQARVEAVINAAISQGIYVIVDWHDHNAQNHGDQAVAFFTAIAQKYGSNPHVLYEIFNEPLQVDWSSVIKPYAERVIAAIRAVDPDNVIIVGTPTWSQDVDVAANSPITGQKNIMYTLHYYAATHKQDLRNKLTTAVNKGLPVFVTEYGTVTADGNGYVDATESQTWWNFLDGLSISYLNWAMDDKDEKSAALTPGSTSAQVGDSSRWTESGKLVQARLASQNNGVSCSGSAATTTTTRATTTTTRTAATTTRAGATTTTTRAPTTTTRAAASSGSGSVSAAVSRVNSWEGGSQVNVVLTNSGSSAICSVRFSVTIPSGTTVAGSWNMDPVSGTSQYNTPSWMQIAAGGNTGNQIGMTLNGSGTPTVAVASSSAC